MVMGIVAPQNQPTKQLAAIVFRMCTTCKLGKLAFVAGAGMPRKYL
jgi:hypothetical protein